MGLEKSLLFKSQFAVIWKIKIVKLNAWSRKNLNKYEIYAGNGCHHNCNQRSWLVQDELNIYLYAFCVLWCYVLLMICVYCPRANKVFSTFVWENTFVIERAAPLQNGNTVTTNRLRHWYGTHIVSTLK